MSHFLKREIVIPTLMITLIVQLLPEIISAKCDLNLEFVQYTAFLIFTTSFLVTRILLLEFF